MANNKGYLIDKSNNKIYPDNFPILIETGITDDQILTAASEGLVLNNIYNNIGNGFKLENGKIIALKNFPLVEIISDGYWLANAIGRKDIRIQRNGTSFTRSLRSANAPSTGFRIPVTSIVYTSVSEGDQFGVHLSGAVGDVYAAYGTFTIKILN